MPGIFHRSIGRREFLTHSSKALAALALSGAARISGADSPAQEEPVRLALLSDAHIPADPQNEYRKFLPCENLKSIVPEVIKTRPEGVILNGDAARLTGELADYQALKGLLAPLAEQAPVYIAMGNHDDRDNFFKTFDSAVVADQKISGKHVLVIERPGIRLIVLDSLLYPNKVAGLLGKAQRTWLARSLENSDGRPTVLFVHHTLGDGDGDLLDVERLFQLIRLQRKVKAIFYGHSHEYSFRKKQDVHLINLPAVGYNFTDNEPVGWMEAAFTAHGVDLKLRAFAGNRRKDGEETSLTWAT